MKRTLQALSRDLARGRLADRSARAALTALPILAALFLPPKSLVETLAASGMDRGEAVSECKAMAVRWGGAALLGVVAFFVLASSRKERAPRDPIQKLGLAGLATLLGATLAASALSISPRHSLWESQALVLPAGLTLLAGWKRLRLRPDTFLCAMFAAGSLLALGGAAGRFGWGGFYGFDQLRPDGRASSGSALGNPEFLGGYLAMLSAGALALLLPSGSARRPRWGLFALAGVLALMAGAMLLTGTRSSPVAMAAGTLWAALASGGGGSGEGGGLRKRFFQAAGVLAAMALLGATLALLPSPLRQPARSLAGRFAALADWRSPSFAERLMANVAGAELVLEKPLLGHGAGMFDARFYDALAAVSRRDGSRLVASAIERFDEKGAGAAHNDYLQAWAESGTLGLAGFLLLAVCLSWPLPPAGPGQESRRQWLVACQAGLAAGLALAFVSFPLRSPGRSCLFWALAAHVLAGRGLTLPPSGELPRAEPPASP